MWRWQNWCWSNLVWTELLETCTGRVSILGLKSRADFWLVSDPGDKTVHVDFYVVLSKFPKRVKSSFTIKKLYQSAHCPLALKFHLFEWLWFFTITIRNRWSCKLPKRWSQSDWSIILMIEFLMCFRARLLNIPQRYQLTFTRWNSRTFLIRTVWVILISVFRVLRTLVLRIHNIIMKLASALFLRTNTYARIQMFFQAWFDTFWWLHRCWWRMLETQCVGDKSEMLMTDLIHWENHQHKL